MTTAITTLLAMQSLFKAGSTTEPAIQATQDIHRNREQSMLLGRL
jgi:hypothetical protein